MINRKVWLYLESWNRKAPAKCFEILIGKKDVVGEEIYISRLAHSDECHAVEM